jgi:hypothetical protein
MGIVDFSKQVKSVLLQLEYIKKRVDYGERVNKGIFNV